MMNNLKKIVCTENYSVEDEETIKLKLRRYNIGDYILKNKGGNVYLTQSRALNPIVTGEEKKFIEPSYWGLELLKTLGANFLNTKYNFEFAVYKGSRGFFLDETETIPQGETSFEGIKITPRRLGIALDVSNELLTQTGGEIAENLSIEMIDALWNLFVSAIFSSEAGTSKRPQGLFYNTLNSVANYDDFLAVENELLSRGIIPTFYLTNPSGYVKLKNLIKVDSVVGESRQITNDTFVTGNSISGIPLLVSYNVNTSSSGQIPSYIVGDFKSLYINEWGKILVNVDKYSEALKGITKLIAQGFLNYAWSEKSYATALLV
jgi:hypothetical protein